MKHSRGVYRGRSSRRYNSRKRGSNNLFSKYKNILFGFIGILFIVGIYKLGFSGTQAESISATTTAQSGSSEFAIENSDQWTFLQDSVDLFAGDKLKTLGNGKSSLSLLGGNTLFLKENTEINILELSQKADKKKAIIELVKGSVWAHIAELDKESSIKIKTTDQTANLSTGAYAFTKDENSTDLTALKGGMDVTINQSNKQASVLELESGNALEISDLNKDNLNEEEKSQYTKEISKKFIESDWNLENLEKFFPSEANAIRQKMSAENTKPTEAGATVASSEIASPSISAPKNNAIIPSETTSVVIEGIAPENTYQISVNGYTLTKYQPGDRKWSYIASTKFGTMVPGKNTYSVTATTRDGKKSAPAQISITYVAPKVSAKPVQKPVATTFAKPVVTSPTGIKPNTPWETSSSIVTLQGTVPKESTKVLVNEFALQKFKPGSGRFSYIANSQYGNFKEGENLYVIKAIGPNNSSETAVTVIYKPVKL